MAPIPSFTSFALLLGLSLFFGLAYEDFHAVSGESRPGGIRTFPLHALAGGMLYLLDPVRLIAFSAGLLALGAWLYAYYRSRLDEAEHESDRAPKVELIAPICNSVAYLIGPVALALPHWIAVGVTVAAVLLLTARERLHALAHSIELTEIVTAGKFLILTGIVLPLLPDQPVTSWIAVTPYQVWLALLAVCTLSYASYLIQRYVAPRGSDLAVAILGGLYSSTATTVVLARQAGQDRARVGRARAGIVLATALMYLRILVIVAVFDMTLARGLALASVALSAAGLAIAGVLYWRAGAVVPASPAITPRNPLELTAAAVFAVLFVIISLLSTWAKASFGAAGIEVLAAIVGVTDIDPFVLNIAQGGATSLPVSAAVAAILIATASNNLLKAGYTAAFAGIRASLPSAVALIALAAGGLAAASWIAFA